MRTVLNRFWNVILFFSTTLILLVSSFQQPSIKDVPHRQIFHKISPRRKPLPGRGNGRNGLLRGRHGIRKSLVVLSSTETKSSSSSFSDDSNDEIDTCDDADQAIEGLVENFETLARIDSTIQELRGQLPRLLTQPLTPQSAADVYTEDCPLVVMVEASSSTSSEPMVQPQEVASTNNTASRDTVDSTNPPKSSRKEIVLTKTREELVSLSDVIVLGNSAARQANNVWNSAVGSSTSNNALPSSMVECQLLLNSESFSPSSNPQSEEIIIRIPWKTTVPVLPLRPPSPSSQSEKSKNQLEGLSELVLNVTSGKIEKHRIVNVMFDGTPMTGPAIGQALTTWQSAVNSFQQSPLVQSFLSPTTTSLLTELRDGFLGQAAATAAFRSEIEEQDSAPSIVTPPVFVVPKEQWQESETIGAPWIHDSDGLSNKAQSREYVTTTSSNGVPYPGTEQFKQYATVHQYLFSFCDSVIPILSTGSTMVDVTRLFSKDVTLSSDVSEGSSSPRPSASPKLLLKGKDDVASYYSSLALARRGAGGSWTLKHVKVDWKACTATIDYEATLRVGLVPATMQWTIKGQDIYYLQKPTSTDNQDESDADYEDFGDPIIERIHQVKFSVSPQDGSVTIDNHWLMRNLARTVEQGNRLGGGVVNRDILSDLLRQSDAGIPNVKSQAVRTESGSDSRPVSTARQRRRRQRLSKSTAAKIYNFMSHMHDEVDCLLDTTNDGDLRGARGNPPGVLYMDKAVELRGYLGETLVRGLAQYKRAVGTFLSAIKQGIDQKILVVSKDKNPPARVLELRSTSQNAQPTIRLTVTLEFRLSSPLVTGGSTMLLPEALKDVASSVATVPLKLEIVSDYVIDPHTGKVDQHRLVESRVNGQLTPGDVLSRNIQRLLKLSSDTNRDNDSEQDLVMRLLSDGFSWLRSMGT